MVDIRYLEDIPARRVVKIRYLVGRVTCMTITDSRLDFDLVDKMQKALRISNIGRTELAERLGMSPNTVTRWMTGRTVPRHRDLIAFAEVTEVPLEWLEESRPRESNPRPSHYE